MGTTHTKKLVDTPARNTNISQPVSARYLIGFFTLMLRNGWTGPNGITKPVFGNEAEASIRYSDEVRTVASLWMVRGAERAHIGIYATEQDGFSGVEILNAAIKGTDGRTTKIDEPTYSDVIRFFDLA